MCYQHVNSLPVNSVCFSILAHFKLSVKHVDLLISIICLFLWQSCSFCQFFSVLARRRSVFVGIMQICWTRSRRGVRARLVLHVMPALELLHEDITGILFSLCYCQLYDAKHDLLVIAKLLFSFLLPADRSSGGWGSGVSLRWPTSDNNNNIQDNVCGAVIMAEPFWEFTRFIWWM